MMHTIFRILLLVLLIGKGVSFLYAQSNVFDYGNEWYTADPTRPFIKLELAETGVYRVHFADLMNAGHDLNGVNADHLQLFYRGKEQAIFVRKDGAGNLLYFDFYGKCNDGRVDSIMYRNPVTGIHQAGIQPDIEMSLFTDTSAYYLSWAGQTGTRLINHRDTNYASYSAEPHYPFSSKVSYQSGAWPLDYVPGGGGPYDSFYTLNTDYTTGEGYVGPSFGFDNACNIDIPTPDAAHAIDTVQASFRIFGRSRTAHHLSVFINGTQQQVLDTLYPNSSIYIKTFEREIPITLYSQTQLSFHALTPATDYNHIIWSAIRYDRLCDLKGAGSTTIAQWQNPTQSSYFSFDHSNGLDSVWAYDLANGIRISGVISDSGEAQIIIPSEVQNRNLHLHTDTDLKTPLIRTHHALSNLCHPDSGAQYLIITHRSLAASAYKYALYRDTVSTNSYSTKVVFTDQIYDEFGYGSLTPWAIKRFINCAWTSWHVKPAFVLLWGKGGYRPRDDSVTLVPTFGYPSSDHEFVRGYEPLSVTFTPQMAIGRVSVFNDQEGGDYLAKVDEFEHSDCEPWRKRGVFLGGGATLGEQSAIQQGNIDMLSSFAYSPFYGIPYVFQKTSDPSQDSLILAEIADTISAGAAIIHTFGHSTSNLFEVPLTDPEDYGNFGKYPLLVSLGSWGGNFSTNQHILGERWLLEVGRGAIGFITNSAAGYLNPLKDYGRILYQQMFVKHIDDPLGEVIRKTGILYTDSLKGIQYRNHARQINLLGDPALHITACSNTVFDAVWPGDANIDGVADMNDLLRIGLGYGINGPARTNATNSWIAQQTPYWDTVFADFVNYKHADCNGDGIIDAADTTAISLNYGSVHNKTTDFIVGGTPLTLVYPSQVQAADTVNIEVFIGDSANTVDLYGIAFSIDYDEEMVAENSVSVDFGTSWLGTEGLDLISMYRDHPLEGKLEVGQTRIDHVSQLGYGKLANITIVITDDLAKKEWGPLNVSFNTGRANDATGIAIPLEGKEAPKIIEVPMVYHHIRIYPSPVDDLLTIEPNGARMRNIELINPKGQKEKTIPGESLHDIQMDMHGLSPGIYLLKYRVGDAFFVEKILLR